MRLGLGMVGVGWYKHHLPTVLSSRAHGWVVVGCRGAAEYSGTQIVEYSPPCAWVRGWLLAEGAAGPRFISWCESGRFTPQTHAPNRPRCERDSALTNYSSRPAARAAPPAAAAPERWRRADTSGGTSPRPPSRNGRAAPTSPRRCARRRPLRRALGSGRAVRVCRTAPDILLLAPYILADPPYELVGAGGLQ